MESSSETKSETKENGVHRNGTSAPDPKDECDRLRAYIIQCPGVPADGQAMKSVLTSLDAFSKSNGGPSNGLAASTRRKSSFRAFRRVGSLFRWLLLDVPVLLIVGLYLSSYIISHVHDEYLSPQMDLMLYEAERSETEVTYYSRVCDEQDITTRSVDDLVMPANVTAQEAKEHMLTHGVSIYHDVIQPETANELRDFILEANKREANYYVIGQEHRYTFGLRFDHHPSVAKAMHELATHPTLLPALEAIAGPNPAIIEVAPITSEYGAEEQYWHQDTLPMASSFKHARSFFPSYSIFIPLQDTSRRIGSTQVCPGSHVCDEYDGMCQSSGIYVSGEQDLWPQGTAAVMNQHLHHRGTAHTMRGGPDRVLLVVTVAPRPLTGKQQVETRQLSEGGAYSLDWKQWGHTLYDFRDAPSAMRQPWMFLRTLGIYKPAGVDWGWDWISTSSMRISNDDNGYHEEQLEEFKEAGGFWFLPATLHGKYDDGWRVFLQETIAKTKSFLDRAVRIGVAANFVLTLVWGLLVCRNGIKATLWGWTFRFVMLCAIETLLAWLFIRQVARTPWATHIRQGKSYHLDVASKYGTTYLIPGTLPNRDDVLLATRYNSRHLWSYNEIVDYSHPGNKRFREMVMKSSTGYEDLPDSMKRHLVDNLMERIGQSHGRFLSPNQVGKWSNTPVQQTRLLVHYELVKRANPLVGQILTELSYLVAETEFGYWRTHAISRHISDALRQLQDKIVISPRWKTPNSLIVLQGGEKSQPSRSLLTVRSFLPPPPASNYTILRSVHLRGNAFPARPPVEEPFQGAWLKEGDVVEGKYECHFNEWYKGRIGYISMDLAAFTVIHVDGYADEDLARQCIRPFVPYRVGEEIAVRVIIEEEEQFVDGRIVAVHPDEHVDVETHEHGMVRGVTAKDIQRFDTTS